MKKLLAILTLAVLFTACNKDEDNTGEPYTISGTIISDCETGSPAANQTFALAIPVPSKLRGKDVETYYENFTTNSKGEFSVTSSRLVYKNSTLAITNADVSGGPGFSILDNIPKQTLNVGSFFYNRNSGLVYRYINVSFKFDLTKSTLIEGDSIYLGWIRRKQFTSSELSLGKSFIRNGGWPLSMSYSSKLGRSVFLLIPSIYIHYKSKPLEDVPFDPVFEVPYNCDTAINLTIKMP